MSKSSKQSITCGRDPCCKRATKLEEMVIELKKKDKFNEYCINHMKAQIRLLYDNIKVIKKASKTSLINIDQMNETLNYRLESGIYLKHNGDEIQYPGENAPLSFETWKVERAAAAASVDSANDNSE